MTVRQRWLLVVAFLCGLVLVYGCGSADAAVVPQDYQQSIRQPDQPLMRWDDTSLGVVCYAPQYGTNAIACVKVQ